MKVISLVLMVVTLLQPQSLSDRQLTEDRMKAMAVPGLAAMAMTPTGEVAQFAGEVKPDSVLALGSITKSVTTLMIARLVDHGILSWDLPLAKALPGVGILPVYRPVTLEDLLRHRGGFGGSIGSYPPNMRWDLSPTKTREFYAANLLNCKPTYPPQSKSEYANANFVLAAIIAERATGKPFSELVREEVATPLALKSLQVGPTQAGDRIAPHIWKEDKWAVVPAGPGAGNPPALFGADGIRMTLADFGKYAFAHACQSVKFLKPETWKRIHSAKDGNTYGMGVMVVDDLPWGGSGLWHNGSNTMNYACMLIDPTRKQAVVAFTNAMRSNLDASMEQFLADFAKAACK